MTYSRALISWECWKHVEMCRMFAYPLVECALRIFHLLLLYCKLIFAFDLQKYIQTRLCSLFCFRSSSVSPKSAILSMSSACGISALPSTLSAEENSELPGPATFYRWNVGTRAKETSYGAWKWQRPLVERPQSCSRPPLLKLAHLSSPLKSRSQTCMLQDSSQACHPPPCPPPFLLQPETTLPPWGRTP